jgi:hypothetical protein
MSGPTPTLGLSSGRPQGARTLPGLLADEAREDAFCQLFDVFRNFSHCALDIIVR